MAILHKLFLEGLNQGLQLLFAARLFLQSLNQTGKESAALPFSGQLDNTKGNSHNLKSLTKQLLPVRLNKYFIESVYLESLDLLEQS